EIPKVNAFVLQGPTNCFKSTLFRLLFDGLNFTPMTRTAGNNNFYLQSCLNKDYIIWEEPMVTTTDINEWKLLLEGAPVKASVKSPDSILKRTPFFITTNHSLSKWISADDAAALQERMYVYTLSQK
ncbi:Uncharacterized protein FKW44_014634, partial [Caligus rogercresseyi]